MNIEIHTSGVFGVVYERLPDGGLRPIGGTRLAFDGETRGHVTLHRNSRTWRLYHEIGYTLAVSEETLRLPLSSFDSIAACVAFFQQEDPHA